MIEQIRHDGEHYCLIALVKCLVGDCGCEVCFAGSARSSKTSHPLNFCGKFLRRLEARASSGVSASKVCERLVFEAVEL